MIKNNKKDNSSKDNKSYDIFYFKNRKLSKKAREYQHEVRHLTIDLLEINKRVDSTLAKCKHSVEIWGEQQKKKHLVDKISHIMYFDDLQYHVENYIFRAQAYRDKLCVFISYAMNLIDSCERDSGLILQLLKNGIIRTFHLDTELKKFNRGLMKEILEKRKTMSHRNYYSMSTYNPMFTPQNISPKKVGLKKASMEWKKNLIRECEKIDKATLQVLDINKRVCAKIVKFLNFDYKLN